MSRFFRAAARFWRLFSVQPALAPRSRSALAAAVAVCCALVPAAVPAAQAAERSAMVLDANSGKVLHSAAADEPRYPASLTKMMTLYLTFELIERGRLSYSSRIKISAQAAAQPPSKLELDAGDTIMVRDAVGALVTKSANDIAVALAEHIGGSEDNFARLMTRKARELGMSRTTFKNASGLPNSDQVTTARDMITLALRLQDDFPVHYKVFATRSFAYNGASFRNHNTLLYHYRGTDGIKTGYTRMSGFNLVSSVRRDGRHLVAAVFGGRTAGQRNAEMRTILDRAFSRATTAKTRQKAPMLVAEPQAAKRPARIASAAAAAPPPPAAPAPAIKAQPAAAKPTAEVAPQPSSPPVASGAATQAVPVAGAAPTSNRIKLASVRQIGVAEHLAERRAARAAQADAAATPQQPATRQPAHEAARPDASQTGNGPASIAELIATSAREQADPRPSALGMQVNGAIQPSPGPAGPIGLLSQQTAPASEPAAAPAAAQADTPARAPSSLQEQLSRILADHRPAAIDGAATVDQPSVQPARQPIAVPATAQPGRARVAELAPPAGPVSDPVPATTTPANGDFQIQIGAYNSPGEAEKFLKTAQQRAGTLLSHAAPLTQTVTRGDRRLYRARFAGLNSLNATEACQALRRQAIDCFVMKAH